MFHVGDEVSFSRKYINRLDADMRKDDSNCNDNFEDCYYRGVIEKTCPNSVKYCGQGRWHHYDCFVAWYDCGDNLVNDCNDGFESECAVRFCDLVKYRHKNKRIVPLVLKMYENINKKQIREYIRHWEKSQKIGGWVHDNITNCDGTKQVKCIALMLVGAGMNNYEVYFGEKVSLTTWRIAECFYADNIDLINEIVTYQRENPRESMRSLVAHFVSATEGTRHFYNQRSWIYGIVDAVCWAANQIVHNLAIA